MKLYPSINISIIVIIYILNKHITNNNYYFKDLFESISDYRKKVLLMFLFKNDKVLLPEIGFSERDINHLNLEFRNILLEQHEEYLNYIKNEEESNVQKILSK